MLNEEIKPIVDMGAVLEELHEDDNFDQQLDEELAEASLEKQEERVEEVHAAIELLDYLVGSEEKLKSYQDSIRELGIRDAEEIKLRYPDKYKSIDRGIEVISDFAGKLSALLIQWSKDMQAIKFEKE